MLFTCTKFKDKVLLIESPPGKDYFAHTSTLREIIEKFGKPLYKHYGITTSSSSSTSSSQTNSNSTDSSQTTTTTENSSSSTSLMTTSDGVNVDFMVWQNTKQ